MSGGGTSDSDLTEELARLLASKDIQDQQRAGDAHIWPGRERLAADRTPVLQARLVALAGDSDEPERRIWDLIVRSVAGFRGTGDPEQRRALLAASVLLDLNPEEFYSLLAGAAPDRADVVWEPVGLSVAKLVDPDKPFERSRAIERRKLVARIYGTNERTFRNYDGKRSDMRRVADGLRRQLLALADRDGASDEAPGLADRRSKPGDLVRRILVAVSVAAFAVAGAGAIYSQASKDRDGGSGSEIEATDAGPRASSSELSGVASELDGSATLTNETAGQTEGSTWTEAVPGDVVRTNITINNRGRNDLLHPLMQPRLYLPPDHPGVRMIDFWVKDGETGEHLQVGSVVVGLQLPDDIECHDVIADSYQGGLEVTEMGVEDGGEQLPRSDSWASMAFVENSIALAQYELPPIAAGDSVALEGSIRWRPADDGKTTIEKLSVKFDSDSELDLDDVGHLVIKVTTRSCSDDPWTIFLNASDVSARPDRAKIRVRASTSIYSPRGRGGLVASSLIDMPADSTLELVENSTVLHEKECDGLTPVESDLGDWLFQSGVTFGAPAFEPRSACGIGPRSQEVTADLRVIAR